MIGCSEAAAWAVAWRFGESSQQPTCPQLKQIRRCNQRSPVLRQSSQPSADSGRRLILIWSRWEQPGIAGPIMTPAASREPRTAEGRRRFAVGPKRKIDPALTVVADTALDLARWQFAATTLYHFIFVPLTLGLAPIVAIMQTLWYRRREEKWLRLTKFFGTLMLINFAIGVATGLVQEFQFGMNWSAFSRVVGDVFGSPLAIEGLGAFFLESTFLGLWVFGWNRLSPKRAPGDDLPRLGRYLAVGILHPRRQLLDATSGRLRDRRGHRERPGAPTSSRSSSRRSPGSQSVTPSSPG